MSCAKIANILSNLSFYVKKRDKIQYVYKDINSIFNAMCNGTLIVYLSWIDIIPTTSVSCEKAFTSQSNSKIPQGNDRASSFSEGLLRETDIQ